MLIKTERGKKNIAVLGFSVIFIVRALFSELCILYYYV